MDASTKDNLEQTGWEKLVQIRDKGTQVGRREDRGTEDRTKCSPGKQTKNTNVHKHVKANIYELHTYCH